MFAFLRYFFKIWKYNPGFFQKEITMKTWHPTKVRESEHAIHYPDHVTGCGAFWIHWLHHNSNVCGWLMITEKEDLVIRDVFQRVSGLFHWKKQLVRYSWLQSNNFINCPLCLGYIQYVGNYKQILWEKMYFEIKTKYKLYIDKFIPLGTGVYIYKCTYK